MAVITSLAALPAAASAAPKTAFVTDRGNSTADQYTIGTDGTLSFSGSASAGSEPWMQAVTPNGKYLYVAN
jgi:DNA-binding beta-propeller fold protein YncE